MSWALFHTESERLAAAAEVASRSGQHEDATRLYREAAKAEENALQALEPAKERTRGITAISAASLHYKASDFETAESLALRYLATAQLPPFAVLELQSLLKTLWSEIEIAAAGLSFSKQDIFVSVRGGEVFTGGAPLDLIVRKIEEIRAFYYRTVEWVLGLPVRMRGAPSHDIQELFRPWLLHAPPGSYQFAVRLQSPPQLEFGFLRPELPQVEEIMQKFIQIVRQSASDPKHGLEVLVPDEGYRGVFMKLARSLAPTGKSYSELAIRTGRSDNLPDAIFRPETRKALNETIKSQRREPPTEIPLEPVELRGTLRAVHLDEDWLEVTVNDPVERHIKVEQAGDAIDDIVGPMINRRVILQAGKSVSGKFVFRDIDAED